MAFDHVGRLRPPDPGESEAVEEFFESRLPRIVKFGWASAPGGYFVKEEADDLRGA
ncbi:MAG TPA: hypothetical protein VEA44_15530 [Caulobacter sp.]|nr:hypothetical protein [Caulobacter sp.]